MKQRRFFWKCLFFTLTFFSFFLNIRGLDDDSWEKQVNALQPPGQVLDAIGLKPGMVAGEIGAGRGRYTVCLARCVGPAGKIYANDVDAASLAYLSRRCERDGIKNIVIVQGQEYDPLLPVASLDLAFMINTFHHLREPFKMLGNIIPSLKPGATLAIVERDPGKIQVSRNEATKPEKLIRLARQAGWELLRLDSFLKNDTLYIFKVKRR